MMQKIDFFGKSDVGLKRSNNEDAYVFDPQSAYCLAADGMGGAAAGELASRFFAETAVEVFSGKKDLSESDAYQFVQDTFYESNRKILEHVVGNPDHEGMGCTAELLAFYNEGFVLGHIGDSRTYRLRQGTLKQLTQDHSFVQDQVNQGILTQAEARTHHLRSVILRAVGIEDELALDLLKGKALSGDIFLLCSDGLTDMVEDNLIQEILNTQNPLAKKGNLLIEAAKAAGGDDNITVVLAEVN